MKTFEELLAEKLNNIPSDVSKGEGTLIYMATAANTAESIQMYIDIEDAYNRTFADTATGEDLTKRAAERGISRKQATAAIRKGVFDVAVSVGNRFSIETLTYIVTELLTGYEAKLQCEQTGEIGNVYSGDMTAITYVSGLTSMQLTDILIPGEDIESDDSLRTRYHDNLESASFAGNKAYYKQYTKELPGVGGCKVYPVWNGGGTVKLVIIDSTYSKPSTTLVDEVQTAIDPIANSGKGLGIAPIGHSVTVDAVTEITVDIISNITLVTGYVWADVESYIQEAINEYFLTLKETWDSEDALVVRVSQIESSILKVTGVLDIQTTQLNGSLTNLILTDIQIPILGTVTQA